MRLITKKDPEALAVMRHSAAHVMAQAVMRLYEGVQLAFGPTTATGFYYDFRLPQPLSEEDFPAIEAEMAKIVAEDERFERLESAAGEAVEAVPRTGPEVQGRAHRDRARRRGDLSFYRQGEFIDLCRGQHIPSTGHIGKAFKLLSVAGAYWKGDASRAAVAAALRHRVLRQEGTRRPSRRSSKRPSAATTACSASSSSCSPSARPSARG